LQDFCSQKLKLWLKVVQSGRKNKSEAGDMFLGEYQHTMDEKGRLFIPARLREGLGNSFVLTRGLDRCLFGYSFEAWKNLEKRINEFPFTNSEVRIFVRFFFAGAAECSLDKQGRILIPQLLREYAVLEKDVCILGVSERIEIWSYENWLSYQKESISRYEEVAEKIFR